MDPVGAIAIRLDAVAISLEAVGWGNCSFRLPNKGVGGTRVLALLIRYMFSIKPASHLHVHKICDVCYVYHLVL